MTTSDRFDPFERRITDAIDEIAAARPPEYLNDILRQTARTSQRPRWTFPERWLPVDTALSRPILFGRPVPLRSLIVLVALLALVAATAIYVGTQRQAAPPYGPAVNGRIAYGSGGDIYVREPNGTTATLLFAGDGVQAGPAFSPNGLLIAYDNVINGADHVWVVDGNGQNARQVFDQPLVTDGEPGQVSWVSWSGDSRHLAIVTSNNGKAGLWIASADGSAAREVDLGGLRPNRGAIWDPIVPGQVLIRALNGVGKVDLFLVDTASGASTPLKIPFPTAFGPDWDLSGHAFSDNGQLIAFNVITGDPALDPAGFYRIGLVNRDGTNPRILPGPADHDINEGWPIFSPDSKSISVQRFGWNDPDGLKASFALLPADGSAVGRDLLPAGVKGQTTFDAAWAPDSSRVFVWNAGLEVGYMIDPATGDREVLDWIHDAASWQRRAP